EQADQPADQAGGGARRGGQAGAAANQPVKDINIDWDGMKRRTRQITRVPNPISAYAVAPDNHTVVFSVNEPSALRPVPAIYSIQDNGRRLVRLASGGAQGQSEEPAEPPAAGGFGFGGIREFAFSRDGRPLFFEEANG